MSSVAFGMMLSRAFVLDWGNFLRLNSLCALPLQDDQTDEAIDYCKRKRGRDDEFGNIHDNLAFAYFATGNIDKSRWHAEKMQEL